MDFEYSDRSKALLEKLNKFMDEVIYPAEPIYEEQMEKAKDRWQLPPIIEECKAEAKKRGLWNMFLPADRETGDTHGTMGLSNLEYAPICEVLGRSSIASEAVNCSAPDTGNMEVFARYGTAEHKEKWLKPLLNGDIRSCFAMTEPAVASSDARNVECRIESDGNDYVINGRKWWSSGMGDPRCKVIILMGKSDPNAPAYRQQSMIVVPRDTPGIKIVKMLHVFGYDDAPHGHAEVVYDNVRVPKSAILLGEGRGFEIAQGRLGPGRIHHCMRAIGVAERALEMAIKRAKSRVAFGQRISEMGVTKAHVADMRMEIDMARLLVLKGRLGDGQVRQQGSPPADRDDQGGGAEHHLEGRRPLPAAAWRRRRQPGVQAREHVRPPAHPAPGRRSGRGPSRPGWPSRDRQVQLDPSPGRNEARSPGIAPFFFWAMRRRKVPRCARDDNGFWIGALRQSEQWCHAERSEGPLSRRQTQETDSVDTPKKNPHVTEHLANERTFLAWIRTAIAVMTLGVAINRFALFLMEIHQVLPEVRHLANRHVEKLGIGLVILGIVMLIGATWHYLHVGRTIEDETYRPANKVMVGTRHPDHRGRRLGPHLAVLGALPRARTSEEKAPTGAARAGRRACRAGRSPARRPRRPAPGLRDRRRRRSGSS